MKIFVIGKEGMYANSFVCALKHMGNDIDFYSISTFTARVSWWERKKHYWGWDKDIYNKFIENEAENIKAEYDRIQPELVINYSEYNISYNIIKYMKKRSKVIIWLIDSLKDKYFYEKIYEKLGWFDKIFSYEKDDAEYIRKNINAQSFFCPVGFDQRYYNKLNENIKRDIDISFVGIRSKYRLETLEKIAQYAYYKNLKMEVYGITLENNARHFWKRNIERKRFIKKYPYLSKVVKNIVSIPAKYAAEIYRRSKIVLNINKTAATAINPRTFEILATGSFQLMDSREDYSGLVIPNVDLAIYKDNNDLITKLQYYLDNKNEREKIAQSGYLKVKNTYEMTSIVKKMLDILDNKVQ